MNAEMTVTEPRRPVWLQATRQHNRAGETVCFRPEAAGL